MIPPATPPGTPYSKPACCATSDEAIPSNPVSGVISAGASTGAAATGRGTAGVGFGGVARATLAGAGFGAAGVGAGGGGGGGGGALTKNAIVSFGVGSVSVAYSAGTARAITTTMCPSADSAAVVHRVDDGPWRDWSM
jgi:hypothetical protein